MSHIQHNSSDRLYHVVPPAPSAGASHVDRQVSPSPTDYRYPHVWILILDSGAWEMSMRESQKCVYFERLLSTGSWVGSMWQHGTQVTKTYQFKNNQLHNQPGTGVTWSPSHLPPDRPPFALKMVGGNVTAMPTISVLVPMSSCYNHMSSHKTETFLIKQ